MKRDDLHRAFARQFCSAASDPATEEEIHFAEIDLSTVFPVTYCDFVKAHGEVETPGIIHVVTKDEKHFPDLQKVITGDACIDVTRAYWKSGMSQSLIVFGRESLGNVFCFERSYSSVRPDDAAVWFFDQDFDEARLLCDSFDGLLRTYLALVDPPTDG